MKILLMRFSALGDIAMTVPIVHALATAYPELEVVMLSRPHVAALFEDMPRNVRFMGADLKGEYAGFKGLNRLLSVLRHEHFDLVADLHDVLRTQYLRLCLGLTGAKVAHIQKGRSGKKQLVRPTHKVKVQQQTSFARYADVLKRLGYEVHPTLTSLFEGHRPELPERMAVTPDAGTTTSTVRRIGIAPFAAHAGKIYPLQKMEQVVATLSARPDTYLYLFGGGPKEEALFADWQQRYPHVTSMIRMGGMHRELEAMSHLDVMLCMDSGNMHLASLTGVPVVSIWGATHPYAGFMGWRQSEANTLQLDLPCRPCSVFGNKPCLRGDMACLNGITPEAVIEKLDSVLQRD